MAKMRKKRRRRRTKQTISHTCEKIKKQKKIAKKAQRQLKIDNIRKTTTKQQKQLCAKKLNFANVLGNETKQQKQREDGPQFGKNRKKTQKSLKNNKTPSIECLNSQTTKEQRKAEN